MGDVPRLRRSASGGDPDREVYRALALAGLVIWVVALVGLLALAGAARVLFGANAGQGATQPRLVAIDAGSGGGRVEVLVEVADTDAERETGLMGRPAGSLARDSGMLFVFDEERPLSFWMKDTEIPLSVAYADSEGRIVDVLDLDPLDETPRPSSRPARYALEVNRGFFEEKGVRVGDAINDGLRRAGPERKDQR